MASKKRKASLPRLTMLAMSKRELTRFSDACERVVGLVEQLAALVARLELMTARSEAARKANRTRKERARCDPEQDEQVSPELEKAREDYHRSMEDVPL